MILRSMTGRAAALLVVVALAVGCGVRAEETPRIRDREEIPFGLADPPAPTTLPPPPASGATPSVVCFSDGELLVRWPIDEAALLGRLRAVPSVDAAAFGFVSALPEPALVQSAAVVAGVAEIEVSDTFTDLPTAVQRLAIAQLVCTAASTPGVGQVRFTQDETPLAVPRGDGSLSDDPVSLDDYRTLLGDE